MQNMNPTPRPGFLAALKRGFKGRCPACGEGKLYWRYLKVEPACRACGHDLAQYPADDGPAYFTILIVGHLIVAPLLLFPFIWQAPVALVLAASPAQAARAARQAARRLGQPGGDAWLHGEAAWRCGEGLVAEDLPSAIPAALLRARGLAVA